MTLSFDGPSHPTQASLGQFFMMKMSQFKFSIPSLDCFKLVMIPTTIKLHSILICDLTMLRNEQAKRRRHEEIAQHDLLTKLEGFQYLLVTLTIVDIFAISSPRWI
jgi:hypothetical protein